MGSPSIDSARQSNPGILQKVDRRSNALSFDFPVQRILLVRFDELSENHWYAYEGQIPTSHSLVEHMRLIDAADLGHPIILNFEGRVMDGMHRV